MAFITAHFPALVTEMSAPVESYGWCGDLGITTTAALGGLSISVIGFANIIGTLVAGWAGKKYKKKWLLSGIYAGRSIVCLVYLDTYYCEYCANFFFRFRVFMVSNSSVNKWTCSSHIWLKIYGTLYGIVSFLIN